MKALISAILDGYSEIIFTQGRAIGFVLFLVTMINPDAGLAGLISALSAYGFAFLIHLRMSDIRPGYFTYNPLLVGLSIGGIFAITPLSALFTAIAGALTFLLTYSMSAIWSHYLRLPILSLPFVLASSLVYLASVNYSNLFVKNLSAASHSGPMAGLPAWWDGFTRAAGAILFQPDPVAGMVILAVILSWSRILFLLAAAGYAAGTIARTLMLGPAAAAGSGASFNFVLIAMAVGGVFLIPSARSYILAIVAVLISTLLLDSAGSFWSYYGIPVFALPFNIVTQAMVYCLGLAVFPYVARSIQKTPERSLDFFVSQSARFGGSERAMPLPFSGRWTVSQAFDGEHTHRGSWRHGYDFVITGANGAHHNGGGALEDYYAYNKPVLSPARGRVVKVVDHLADNVIGATDAANNWGNLVIIEDPRGFYVELSHFSQKKVRVKEGDWVERGALLGLCGNSGYSPFPHIHVQAQLTREIGSISLPFCFSGYLEEGRYHNFGLPGKDAIVESPLPETAMERRFTFLPDEVLEYEVTLGGKAMGRLRLTVKIDPYGAQYFDSGAGRMFFGVFEGTFYVYRIEGEDDLLNKLFLALPSIPLCGKKGISWKDHPPVGAFQAGLREDLLLFLAPFRHGMARSRVELSMIDDRTVAGAAGVDWLGMEWKITAALDDQPGLQAAEVNNHHFIRVKYEARRR